MSEHHIETATLDGSLTLTRTGHDSVEIPLHVTTSAAVTPRFMANVIAAQLAEQITSVLATGAPR